VLVRLLQMHSTRSPIELLIMYVSSLNNFYTTWLCITKSLMLCFVEHSRRCFCILQQGTFVQSHKPAAADLKVFNGKKRRVAGGACKHIRAASSHHIYSQFRQLPHRRRICLLGSSMVNLLSCTQSWRWSWLLRSCFLFCFSLMIPLDIVERPQFEFYLSCFVCP